MDAVNGQSVLCSAVTQEEWAQIPIAVAQKLQAHVDEKIDELLTSKALSETYKYTAETNANELQEKLNAASGNLQEFEFKFDAATRTITELEHQVTTCTSDMNKLQLACNRLEEEAADFRHQRNLALGEGDQLVKTIEIRDDQIQQLKQELASTKESLQDAIDTKCVALADAQEVAALKMTYEYKLKHFDSERATLISQIESLTSDLDKRVEELLNLKKNNSLRCVQLEHKVIEKTEELAIANEYVKNLTQTNDELIKKIQQSSSLLKDERDKDDSTHDLYKQEVDAQKNLAYLYKDMFDQSNSKVDELANGVAELQSLLHTATEKCGDYETKYKELQLSSNEIIQKKNEYIDMLKQEINAKNESFKIIQDEGLLKEVEHVSPAAAAASKLLKPDMSLNQMVSQNSALNMQLARTKEENQRLESYLQHIITELEQKGPLLKRQREDYENALETVKDVSNQNDCLMLENQQLKEEALLCKRNEGIVSRENARLKKDVADLSRQVCHLLEKVEQRSGSSSTSEHDMSDSTSSGDIITKRLVTFSDIVELQSTNQRLLSVVRELSEKQEESESFDPAAITQMRMKLESLQETQQGLLEQQENQNKMMGMVIGQRDMYKTLYDQAIKGASDDIPMQMERPYIPDGQRGLSSPKGHEDADFDGEKGEVHDLENQLEKARIEIKTLKEENDTYQKEKTANEKILLEQLEDTRKEIREVIKQNCKLVSTAEMNEERFKIIQSNVEVYKNQLSALEKQNKIYSDSIIKHETLATYLKNETLENTTKLSEAEVKLANLEKQNALLKDRESRLLKDFEFLKKESLARNVLQNNIELIKVTLERNEAERQIRGEVRLDEAHRECAALRLNLKEEQERFRELTAHVEKQTQSVQAQMEDEKKASEKLRKELIEVREQLISKQNQIEELSKKIKTSLSSFPDSSADNTKLRELEKVLIDRQAEVESLQQQLKIANNTVQQHCSIAEGAEKQMKIMLDEQENCRKLTESKLREKESRIMKLEEQCAELQGELSIQNEGPDAVSSDLRGSLKNLQAEFNDCKTELEETCQKLQTTTAEIKILAGNLEEAENKYTREMMLHSSDLQALSTLKEELSVALSQIEEFKHARDQAVTALEERKQRFATQEEFFKKEKEELHTRFKDMDSQNALLLDQITTLNLQLNVIQNQTSDPNQSIDAAGDANLSRSFTEDDVKSSGQLLKIIKYLRQEKDISYNKCEIYEAEHLRLKSRYDSLSKQLEEAKLALENERQNSELAMMAATRQSDVMRKVETLNALTDSNRSLRQERDVLAGQVNEFSARITLLEDQIAPLQEKNKEFSAKIDAVQSENSTLRGEATRWRQRANILIEKSNRTSPEDWKKLQAERENLAKQLTVEHGNVAKLTEEINNLKNDKVKVDDQLRVLKVKYSQLNEELSKVRDDLQKVQEQVSHTTTELEQTRENYTRLIQEKNKLEESSAGKSETISELKSNLVAVKKIAKKYKQQFEELTTDHAALKRELEERQKSEVLATERQEQLHSNTVSELEERIVQQEQAHNVKVVELTQQVASATEECQNFKTEVDSLNKLALEKEERFKTIFKSAKERIMNLTGLNHSLRAEVVGTRSSSDGDLEKSSQIERLLQEKEEIIAEKQVEKERYQNEVETLNQRVVQLQRQLGQQSSKPSTSSGCLEKSNIEPPTANIKPMAGSLINIQGQSIQITPWRSGPETPLASIRPMSMQRTAAVLPTSQGASTSQGPIMVTPQQVHTTGPSTTIEPLSNSPTSSHTEYMPATSSATPTTVGPRQLAVPPTQSTQDTEDDENGLQSQPTLQQQAVAMVLPRIEQPNNGPAQESGTSSSSSNTVTTTQAGHKRQRDVDNDGCQSEEQGKSQQQTKRTRVQQGTTDTLPSHGTVTDSGLDVEYQVPTSSQRDHEEDNEAVIVVESDEDGDGPDEGEGVDDDPDTEGYDMETYPEQELNYDDADCQEMEEEEVSNEVDIADDSSEVPNQSERSLQENAAQEENSEQAQSEAISSGSDGTSGVTVSQASTSVAPIFSRTRSVAPLSRQQQSHLVLPHGMEEGGDDGIVPSTPTLFVPRRSDGFSEAVSSPHVPTSAGRFTFNESTPANNSGSVEAVPEQTLEFSTTDDNGTGRSVPGTPLQSSPQESGPSSDDHNMNQNTSESNIPSITVSGVSDEADAIPDESMGPPSTVGTAADALQPSETQNDEMPESEDGVTSEGEKPIPSEESEEEGREAEASPSTNTRSRSSASRGNGSVARRSIRSNHMSGGMARPSPTPIVWHDVHEQRHQHNRNRPNQSNFAPRVARRSRGRSPRNQYGGRY